MNKLFANGKEITLHFITWSVVVGGCLWLFNYPSEELRFAIRGTVESIDESTLVVNIENTETYLNSTPNIKKQRLSVDKKTEYFKQRFIEEEGIMIGTTGMQRVPKSQLLVGESVYVDISSDSSYAERIYFGEPTLRF